MNTRLDDLSMFVSLVEAGSFTLAAKQLNIPKSKLSRHLVQLEQTIGSQLLIRTTRSQQLTESGYLLYQASKTHIDALRGVEEEIGSFINEPKGQLTILLPLEFFNQVISSLITEFAKNYPKIKLNCSHYSGSLPDNDHLYDLTFVLHETDLPASNWIAKALLSFPQSIFAGRDFENNEELELNALKELPCILSEQQEQWLFRDGTDIQSVSVKGRASFSSPSMRLQAVMQNLGVAKLPDYTCQEACDLQRLRLVKQPVAMQLSVLYQSRDIPIKTRVFLDFFQSHLGRLSND
ncbi:LysR family transcriptional regulator [Agaribacter marinus]|uniref:LysR family transcriptional regulator n=1 Tax=Agaribacter marinus TaxID=1431249 RepID=A0AA37SYJ6_9ALTE|nr:LysR family transcriptional regulator [Agaribacter marinus]GLR70569.1 LysR family transcriptional regulator [Agaribacter marinus]